MQHSCSWISWLYYSIWCTTTSYFHKFVLLLMYWLYFSWLWYYHQLTRSVFLRLSWLDRPRVLHLIRYPLIRSASASARADADRHLRMRMRMRIGMVSDPTIRSIRSIRKCSCIKNFFLKKKSCFKRKYSIEASNNFSLLKVVSYKYWRK